MPALLPPPAPGRLDLFPAATDFVAWDAQSAEGRKVREAAQAARRDRQERGEVLLEQLTDSREEVNRRRLALLHKKFHSADGLSAAEEEELGRLQASFETYLDTVRPVPHHVLDELEALADQLEAEDERS